MIAGNFLIGQSSTKIATYAISLSSSVSAATSCWTVAPGWPVFPLSFENLTLEWVSKWKKNQTIFSRLTYGAEWCITNFSLKVMSDTPWAIYSRTFSCPTPFLNSKWILKFLYLEDNLKIYDNLKIFEFRSLWVSIPQVAVHADHADQRSHVPGDWVVFGLDWAEKKTFMKQISTFESKFWKVNKLLN